MGQGSCSTRAFSFGFNPHLPFSLPLIISFSLLNQGDEDLLDTWERFGIFFLSLLFILPFTL